MKEYELYHSQLCSEMSLKDLASTIIYMYLFEGMTLRDIEKRIYGDKEFKGGLSKAVLNFYGISTETEASNCGMYEGQSVMTLATELIRSDDCSRQIVGDLLWHYQKTALQDSNEAGCPIAQS